MKTIILNGSPSKNWNTALLLKEAQKGAESAGAETEYIDLKTDLIDANQLANIFSKHLQVTSIISNDKMYQVAGRKI